jgi:CDP-6-deoxy-D-xylo-4-hexulose-3-dehydrase
MSEKVEQILALVEQYVEEKNSKEWKPGEDWLAYSGPVFDSEEYKAAIKTLLDGWLIYGKQARKFELQFAQELGKKFGVLTNSGSSANLLMTAALTSNSKYIKKRWNLKKGSKFITPIVCFPTTINPLMQCGFDPVFVDVTLPDLNLDLDQVEDLLKKDVDREIRGICFAHVLGNPPDMDRLMSLVEKYNLIFLEDACDALGSTYDGKKLGSFGDISTCSFFPAHHMTMGEGGFVATNIGKLRQVIASFRDWGRACYCNTACPGNVTAATACGNRFGEWLPGAPGANYDHRYVFNEIGFNLKPLDLQASIGLKQLDKLEDFHEARKVNFAKMTNIFKPYEQYFHLPVATDKSDPSWFGYLLTIKEGAGFTRADFINHLEGSKIQTRSYFSGNVLYHPGYQHIAESYENLTEQFPVAHTVTFNSFFLGTFIGIDDNKLAYIKEVVDRFFEAKL